MSALPLKINKIYNYLKHLLLLEMELVEHGFVEGKQALQPMKFSINKTRKWQAHFSDFKLREIGANVMRLWKGIFPHITISEKPGASAVTRPHSFQFLQETTAWLWQWPPNGKTGPLLFIHFYCFITWVSPRFFLFYKLIFGSILLFPGNFANIQKRRFIDTCAGVAFGSKYYYLLF